MNPHKRSIIFFIFIFPFAAVFWTSFAHALSLGSIDIKAGFGEKFDAEIELFQANTESLRVFVGSAEDYQRLEKPRATLVDDLRVHVSEWVRDKRIIRVFSDKPLFYPSFNLVVRVETEGGTLLENYLVAVDFRQSVKLGLKGRKTVGELEKAPAPGANEPVLLEKAEIEKEPQPTPVQAAPVSPVDQPEHEPKKETSPNSEEPPAPKSKPIVETVAVEPEAPEKQIEEPETKPEPKPIPKPEPKPKSPLAGEPVLELVRRGDSLFKISQRLKIEPGQAARFAVAVWMDNKDKFLGGNVHGVQEGASLNLAALSARMEEIDDSAAREILKSQWKEWKNRSGQLEEAEADGTDGPVVEAALPAGKNPDPEGLFRLLEDWKTSWESGDLERHLSHFTDGTPEREEDWLKERYAYLADYKRKIFQDNKNVKVDIGKPVVEKRRSYWLISFDQNFRSDSSENAGRKTLKLVRRDGDWKILNEWIHLRKSGGAKKDLEEQKESVADAAGPMESPFVVHISDHDDLDSATRAVNQLRRKGYGAYSSLAGGDGEGKRLYQVFVGRFSDWDETERVTKSVRRMDAGKSAAPVRFPYTLETGTFTNDREAIEFVKALRGKGFSSYLHRSFANGAGSMQIKVMAGAYRGKKELEAATLEMQIKGIAYSIAAP